MDIDITITRDDENNVEILVESARAQSLYEFLRARRFAPTYPQNAIFSAVGLRRLSDGRVVRQYQAVVHELSLIDSTKTVEAAIGECLSSQA